MVATGVALNIRLATVAFTVPPTFPDVPSYTYAERVLGTVLPTELAIVLHILLLLTTVIMILLFLLHRPYQLLLNII